MQLINASAEKKRESQRIYHDETLAALRKTREILGKIGEIYYHQFEKDEQKLIDAVISAETVTTLLAVAAVALGIFAAVLITRGMTRSIIKGVGLAEAMSKGDLTRTLDLDQKDELGMLASALNHMAHNLREMITNTTNGVGTLTEASAGLSAISQRLAAGAEQTSGKSNQVASAAEQMNANMNSVASASEEASTNVQMVATAAEQMSATLNEIAGNTEKGRTITAGAVDQAQQVLARVGELGQAVSAIGKVTETINEISEQTNLLALNATIEAARAGEAGKGFAVVANEIKELAKQTADATQDVRQKLDTIQSSTEITVKEISQIEKVIGEINDIVVTIATAMEEQSTATKEIAGNVNQALIEINVPDGVDENVIRIVSENANALKFNYTNFEKE